MAPGDAFLAAYGMGSAVGIALLDPLARRRLWLGLWRDARAPAFTEKCGVARRPTA